MTVLIGWLALHPVGCASFRSVEPGAIYRAHGLSTEQLEAALDTNAIQTVVNLRGFAPDQPWYREQRQLCEQRKLEHVDIHLGAGAPDRGEIIALLEVFRTARKPILLASDATGFDSGFAAALYRLAIQKESKDKARQELAWLESRHAPLARLREHDRFLFEWQDERDFYANYQIERTARWNPSARREERPSTRAAALRAERDPRGPVPPASVTRSTSARYPSSEAVPWSADLCLAASPQGGYEPTRVLRDYDAAVGDRLGHDRTILVGRPLPWSWHARRSRPAPLRAPAPPAVSLGAPIPIDESRSLFRIGRDADPEVVPVSLRTE